MDDPTNSSTRGADATGVTIIGARQARDAARDVARDAARDAAGDAGADKTRVQWADEHDDAPGVSEQLALVGHEHGDHAHDDDEHDDDDSGMDAAWMDAGDTTLGDLLGNVAPSDAPAPGRPSFASVVSDRFDDLDSAAAADDERHADADEDDDESDDDDVFPESMYVHESSANDPDRVGEDTGVIVAAAAATLERRERRMAERRTELRVDDAPAPQAAKPTDQSDDRWGAFAGSGPRWRDDAKDWADVDAADTSVLGDEATQVGTLGGRRSEESDLYAIDAPAGGTRRRGASTPGAAARGAAATTDDDDDEQANVIRFDSLAKDPDVIPVRSGGPAQRSDRRRSGAGRPAQPDAERPGPARGPADGNATRRPASGGGSRQARPERPAPQSTVTARLGTGALLILAVGLVFTFTGTIGAAVLAAIAIAMASIELMHALKDRGFRPAIPAVAMGLAGVVGAGMWRGERGVMVAIVVTVAAIASWYLFGAERERPAANLAASFLAFGYPAIGAATAALLLNAPHGLGLLMPAIVCTVAHDVFAYTGGRLIGRTHFTDISPNKTVEGLVIGILGSVLVSVLLFGRLGWHPWSGYPEAIALGLVVGIAAPIGDLFESLLKRDLNIKDMGKLLPGHGGVFDRIDAMLLAVPATWLVALATGHL